MDAAGELAQLLDRELRVARARAISLKACSGSAANRASARPSVAATATIRC